MFISMTWKHVLLLCQYLTGYCINPTDIIAVSAPPFPIAHGMTFHHQHGERQPEEPHAIPLSCLLVIAR